MARIDDVQAELREARAERDRLRSKREEMRAERDAARAEVATAFNSGVEAAAALFDTRKANHEAHAAELRAAGGSPEEFLNGVDDAAVSAGWDAEAVRGLKRKP